MKENYYLEFLKTYHEIKKSYKEGELPKLLLHVCCGACSSFPLPFLIDLFDITIYFSNSNIYPFEEYSMRLNALTRYVNFLNGKLKSNIKIITDVYNYDEFKKDILPYANEKEGQNRCKICIAKRIDRAFIFALNNNFPYVTTIMTVSRNKDVDFINEAGKALEEKYSKKVIFIPTDFKKNNGQDIGVDISKRFNTYRQDYCGCEFSFNK